MDARKATFPTIRGDSFLMLLEELGKLLQFSTSDNPIQIPEEKKEKKNGKKSTFI